MGKTTGFIEIDRQERKYEPASSRIKHYKEFIVPLNSSEVSKQGARCMDCGIPYCHQGCPVNNLIPEWNDLAYKKDWKRALKILHSTNNFPEFTGRICPAPCEASCTLNIIDNPVTIKSIECAIVDKAWKNGWIKPYLATQKTGKKVAIIGSGPAGMAASQQLVRAGHQVSLYEKNSKIGGLLRYGIPDFKMEKTHIDRREKQMMEEGVTVFTNINVGADLSVEDLLNQNDAVIFSGGAEMPRDLPIKGRHLEGVEFAMDFLPQQNKRVSQEDFYGSKTISATGKHVVVIGGGDTGSDCIGTSIRQGALSVTQLEIMPEPPEKEDKLLTWPNWPLKLRTSSSQEEGASREFSIMTQNFKGKNGIIEYIDCIKVNSNFEPLKGTEFVLRADLVLLAMGFIAPVKHGLLASSGVKLDARGNVCATATDYKTNHPKIWCAGDMRRGQSLVVWAIREGRQCAHSVDQALMGKSLLPR